ncbi:MAG: dynamin family protein [Acidimicrobiales bacterium]|nr:dynamin family protein [Acidimicrobiales bacterium]
MSQTTANPTTEPSVTEQALALLDLGLKATTAYERPDLTTRLQSVRGTLASNTSNVVVIGEFKQGKSSLVNALLNAAVCAVDDDIATAIPAYICYGDPAAAEVLLVDPDHPDAPPARQPIDLKEVPLYVTDAGPYRSEATKGVEIRLPRKLLAPGLTLIDTPGVGGLGSAHGLATMGALSLADAVLFVTDASQELTASEIEFFRQAADLCPKFAFALTKIDFYPSWRKILDLDRGHLERAGVNAQILPLAAPLRIRAARTNDRTLNDESGYPALIRFLTDEVTVGGRKADAARASAEVADAARQLEAQYESERQSLADPAAAQRAIEQLTETKSRAERLRSQAAKWQQTLGDGIADLASEVDFDFRTRTRRLIEECDAAIDDSDPADTWPEFEPWLEQRLSAEVLSNYKLLRDISARLAERVSDHFGEDAGQISSDLSVYDPGVLISQVDVESKVDLDKPGVGKQGFSLLRGSYMGILMFSMLGSMAGITLGPLAIGIGLVMGRKTLKEEKERQLAMRRAQAKNAVRRYCDEVNFQVGKDSKDTLRRVQRELRDYYEQRAKELQTSTTEALTAAQAAAKNTEAERQQRLRNVEAELQRIRSLVQQANQLVGATTS